MPKQDINNPASAINLAEISAHPTEALAALIEVVRLQGDEIRHLQENQSIQATLIAKLKSRIDPVTGEEEKSRAEILKGLVILNGGKMVAKEARLKMKLDKATFSRLISHIEEIEVRPMRTDKRRYILILRSENS
jgi:hypothetical protein